MTARDFIAKWQHVELKERSASQEHFIDLCRLVGHPTPVELDPTGDCFCFERGVSKHGGGEGFADVWKRGFFGWEYKGKHKDLNAAYNQLLLYRDALESPPLLVLCDLDRIIVHTNFTNTASDRHEIQLAEIGEPRNLEVLRAVFFSPDKLRPGQTSEAVTRLAAEKIADIAESMRKRNLDAQAVAHFLDRVVFCMFAEDIGLLPAAIFTRIAQTAAKEPDRFCLLVGSLFKSMSTGGDFGVDRIKYFNGSLFDQADVPLLTADEVSRIVAAVRLDWSAVDPTENRLATYTFGIGSETGTLRTAYNQDHMGRRVKKLNQESKQKNPGGIVPLTYWHTNEVTTFVYDGWNLIHERVVHTNGTVDEIEYVWGLDLSGSPQGAGGVGGLLFEKRNGAIYIPCYDANGNITAYVDTNGTVRAYRQFDAFGNTIAKGGDMVDVFHFRFSTKYLDHDTGLYYYGYRYYSPMLQRWVNRDPIEEAGGLHLYGFVGNSPVNGFDPFGLDQISICTENKQSDKYAVYWIVVDKNQASTREIKVGTIDSSYENVTLNSEFDNRQFNFWELARVAGAINERFGFLNSFEERVQKGAIKLALKHPKTPSSYPSLDEAGTWGSWLARGKSHGNGWEFAGWISNVSGSYTLGTFVTSQSSETVRLWVLNPIGDNPNIAGWFHNHPDGGEGLSGNDQAAQDMFKTLTKNDGTPEVFSSFGYALSPKGIVVKTSGRGNRDVSVYP